LPGLVDVQNSFCDAKEVKKMVGQTGFIGRVPTNGNQHCCKAD